MNRQRKSIWIKITITTIIFISLIALLFTPLGQQALQDVLSMLADNSQVEPMTPPKEESPTSELITYYAEHITPQDQSNIKDGSVKYGATIILGELDNHGRSTYAHIRLMDEHEPGYKDPATGKPREKRNERINVDPVGWKNFKIDGNWANNRCHLVGYQFSGLNDELRNLATCTSYLNKGSETSGTDMHNPDGMLFYEQRLDKWLADNPTYELDLYVKPIYTTHHTTPSAYYMQWVGFDESNNQIAIDIEGHSQLVVDSTYGVLLENMSPSYNVNTETGIVTKK